MPRPRTFWLVPGFLALAAGVARADDGPIGGFEPTGRDLAILQDEGMPPRRPISGPPHEATGRSPSAPAPVLVAKAPPAPIFERPTAARPSPGAEWVEGYWAWAPDRGDFGWVSGTWLVPPRGQFWVNGSWRRDDRGWARTPGFWSARRPGMGPEDALALADWRTQGPPADRPEDPSGPAPGPEHFHVPGHYAPDGSKVAWKAGFWAKSQPGWEWSPARWDRLADGWTFREGRWTRPAAGVILASRRPEVAEEILPPAERPASTPAVAPVALAPVPSPAPTASALVPLADRLAGESEAFVRAVSANARILSEPGAFVAEGRRVQSAALRLRQAAATDPARVPGELGNLDASWQALYARVRRVSRGRVGPFVQLALRMGATTGEILRQGP